MLKKRIIPCLDIKDGRTVKGINFLGLRDAGDPVELAKEYVQQGADELVFLDITATKEKREALLPLVERIARAINIPFTVGGGIDSIAIAAALINSGADKISVNSAAVKNPALIVELAARFGGQCVVVAIDVKRIGNNWEMFVNGGALSTGLHAIDWAMQVVKLGAGEILLTSMDHDGTKAGFALDVIDTISRSVNVPVIASGGGGNKQHFVELFKNTNASAALAASIFHFKEVMIPDLKTILNNEQISVRCN